MHIPRKQLGVVTLRVCAFLFLYVTSAFWLRTTVQAQRANRVFTYIGAWSLINDKI